MSETFVLFGGTHSESIRMCENMSETFVIFGGTHSESGKESIWDPPAAAICHSHACDCHCTKYFLLLLEYFLISSDTYIGCFIIFLLIILHPGAIYLRF